MREGYVPGGGPGASAAAWLGAAAAVAVAAASGCARSGPAAPRPAAVTPAETPEDTAVDVSIAGESFWPHVRASFVSPDRSESSSSFSASLSAGGTVAALGPCLRSPTRLPAPGPGAGG